MAHASFNNCTFSNSYFRSASMKSTSFQSSTFEDCNFERAKIEETDFRFATLIESDLRRAQVVSFDISGANLEKAFGSYLEYSLNSAKTDGINAINARELTSTNELFKKAKFDEQTNVSEAVHEIVRLMSQQNVRDTN